MKWLEQKYSSKVCDKFLSDKGVKVTNSDIEEFKRVDGISDKNGFVVYGDIMITDEEKDYLNLSPKFREYELLDVKSWNTEVEINAIKTRWELMGNAKKDGKTEEEILEEIKKENESRVIYDIEAGKVNLSNYRVTDIPTVTRVFPPRPANGNQEMKIQEQCNLAKEAFTEYRTKNCDDKGKLKKGNLSVSQMIGKKRLRRRVKRKEIVIATTYKSGKFVLTTHEIYRFAANKHLCKDIEVGWECVKETENFLNHHTTHLSKIFQMGGNHDQVERVKSVVKSFDNPPPAAYFMFKDHKTAVDGEPCPSTRPVVAGKEGILARLSHLASRILTPVADKLSEIMGTECNNGEEMMRGVQDTNERIIESNEPENASRGMEGTEKKELIVMSQDVKAIYPSIEKAKTVEIIGELVEKSEINFNDVDYKDMGKYLAVHLTPEDIAKNNLISVIPTRRKERNGPVRGAKPTVAYLENDLDANKEPKWDWKGKRKNPTQQQKKRMLARTMEIVVDVIMSSHLYQFDGQVYKQLTGGPIGLEITGVLARLVMLWWDGKFLTKLQILGVWLEFYLRYVDDGNMAAWALPPGTRLIGDRLSILEEHVENDKLIPSDKRTAAVLRCVANTICPMIIMEEDVPSNH